MLPMPLLTSQHPSHSFTASLEGPYIHTNNFPTLEPLEGHDSSDYSEQQIIMEIQNSPQIEGIAKMEPILAHNSLTAADRQKGYGNYQRFKIMEKKFHIESDEDSCDLQPVKESSPKGRCQNQSLFFTQILQSKVFHRDIIQAARTQACLKDSLTTDQLLPNQTHQHDRQTEGSPIAGASTLSFSAKVAILMGKQWVSEKISVRKQELRFSDFWMDVRGLSKIKIGVEGRSGGTLRIKMTVNGSDYIMRVTDEPAESMTEFILFAHIMKAKLASMGIETVQGDPLHQYLFKKSQYLSRWERRQVVINEDALRSYQNGECTFQINKQATRQLWTRFEFVDSSLIIKIRHSLKKTQFGIPVTDFTEHAARNWLHAFYTLLKTH